MSVKINQNFQNTAFLLVNIHVLIELYALIFPEKETFNSNSITSLSLAKKSTGFFAVMRWNHFVFAECEHF